MKRVAWLLLLWCVVFASPVNGDEPPKPLVSGVKGLAPPWPGRAASSTSPSAAARDEQAAAFASSRMASRSPS